MSNPDIEARSDMITGGVYVVRPLPYELTQAVIQCFGKCFHFKDSVASFMIGCQVPKELIDRCRHEPKFVWARHVMTELATDGDGVLKQRRILTELCKFRNIPDAGVVDRDAGLDALRELKRLAIKHNMIAKEEQEKAIDRRSIMEERARLARERANKLEDLRRQFGVGLTNPDRQNAGYSLETLLKDLFSMFEIEYRKSYRTPTQQIDGHFRFEGFDYLVEAK